MTPKPYAYHCRPGYGSEKLLLEFIRGAETPGFMEDLLAALDPLEPEWGEAREMWMNDDVWIDLWTRMGPLLFTRDIWGTAFIMGDENQVTIEVIDGLLRGHEEFEKIEVDFANYRREKKDDVP
jgi:hypothetical protein